MRRRCCRSCLSWRQSGLGCRSSDHMVLQREKPVAVWGLPDPDSTAQAATMWGQAPELGFEMVTFLTFLARYGTGGGTSRRVPEGSLMSGFEKPPAPNVEKGTDDVVFRSSDGAFSVHWMQSQTPIRLTRALQSDGSCRVNRMRRRLSIRCAFAFQSIETFFTFLT